MTSPALVELGLTQGMTVRFRRRAGGRWHEGTVVGRERDGSVSVRDSDGRSRALRPDALEVKETGPRGAVRWQPVVAVAARTDQLALTFDEATPKKRQRRRPPR